MSQSVYDLITKQITDALGAGVVPWRKPWTSASPINAVSHRPYRGMNLFLLSLKPFRDHRWVTFRQARELGGYVRPGEHSTLAIFYKRWEPEAPEDTEADAPKKPTFKPRSVPILRFYHVFNVEQCDDLTLKPLEVLLPANPDERIERAQALVRSMPDCPEIDENCRAAWYRPADDLVGMPPFESFTSADAFYATLFHELAHATGHEKRLGRKGVMGSMQFGSETYGHEELVSELTSAYCCASLGLDNSLVNNSAAYIENWLKAIRADPKAILIAAGQAQRAADYIHGDQAAEAAA